mmetsp:Transcript_2586/g.4217  ORF Transcript_2586/g.4217 Transcript_2586/m.4217 type:complete len:215 (-) Transcript_2586:250-894(-)
MNDVEFVQIQHGVCAIQCQMSSCFQWNIIMTQSIVSRTIWTILANNSHATVRLNGGAHHQHNIRMSQTGENFEFAHKIFNCFIRNQLVGYFLDGTCHTPQFCRPYFTKRTCSNFFFKLNVVPLNDPVARSSECNTRANALGTRLRRRAERVGMRRGRRSGVVVVQQSVVVGHDRHGRGQWSHRHGAVHTLQAVYGCRWRRHGQCGCRWWYVCRR